MENNDFQRLGYQVVKGIIDPANYLRYLMLLMKQNEGKELHDRTKAIHFPKAFMFEKLLVALQPAIESYCGYELRPTYSLARVYQIGSMLRKHIDQEACEVTISLCLGNEKEGWPLWFMDREKTTHSVILEPGDGFLLMGQELRHWREINTIGNVYQVFLHYVGKNSKYIEPPLNPHCVLPR